MTSSSDIGLRIAIPCDGLGRRRFDRNRPAQHDHFHVVITNVSDHAIGIWSEACWQGYDCLSFEWENSAGLKGLARKKPIDWTVNKVDFWKLLPQEIFVWNVYLAAPEWIGIPERPTPRYDATENAIWPGYQLRMRAIFNSHSMDDGLKQILKSRGLSDAELDIWAGQVDSPWDTYVLYDYRG